MKKILIVKLGAMGDVLRTTPLLTAYHRKYPQCKITWIVDQACAGVLYGNPLIQDLLTYSDAILRLISFERYDIAINLDKEKEALDCIAAAKADVKQGFGWNPDKSGIQALNAASEYAVRLGIDDDLKFRQNEKTYQQISYEQAELDYSLDEYLFQINDEEHEYADSVFDELELMPYEMIGVNTGAGGRFAGKRLPIESIIEFSKKCHELTGIRTALLGGPEEKERNIAIEKESKQHAVNLGTHHTIQQFAGIVSRCRAILTGDTIAMHIAIAMKVPALVYFGSTCPSEIELYNRGSKIITDIDCAPCYKKDCPIDEKCMSEFSMDFFFQEMQKLLEINSTFNQN